MEIELAPNPNDFHIGAMAPGSSATDRLISWEALHVAQSLSSILIHLIFSTKHREPWVSVEVEPDLHAYMAGILKKKDCPALIIGGMPDHVHVLFTLARTTSVSAVVEDLKSESSKWIKTQGASFRKFHWQAGYGAFSIGQSSVAETRRYIDNQKEHHEKRTFPEEYRVFLTKYGVGYDERYVWD
jgi:putative transposase